MGKIEKFCKQVENILSVLNDETLDSNEFDMEFDIVNYYLDNCIFGIKEEIITKLNRLKDENIDKVQQYNTLIDKMYKATDI